MRYVNFDFRISGYTIGYIIGSLNYIKDQMVAENDKKKQDEMR